MNIATLFTQFKVYIIIGAAGIVALVSAYLYIVGTTTDRVTKERDDYWLKAIQTANQNAKPDTVIQYKYIETPSVSGVSGDEDVTDQTVKQQNIIDSVKKFYETTNANKDSVIDVLLQPQETTFGDSTIGEVYVRHEPARPPLDSWFWTINPPQIKEKDVTVSRNAILPPPPRTDWDIVAYIGGGAIVGGIITYAVLSLTKK